MGTETRPAPRIAYLLSAYPALSHSFVRREIRALREHGVEVLPFSIRRANGADLIAPEDREEAKVTRALLPTSLRALLAAHGWAVARAPLRYFGALFHALRHRPTGARELGRAFAYFAESMLLARELARVRAGWLHNHFANAGSDVGVLAARYLDLPWSLMLHGTCDYEYPATATLAGKAASARFVACASSFGRAQAMRYLPAQLWPKLHIVRCGLDLRGERPTRRRGSDEGRLRVLCVARLSDEKGLLGLLDAVDRALALGASLELRLVGDGPQRGQIEARVRELERSDSVTLTGALAGDALRAEFEAADVLVSSSLMEGLPVVLMEAMAQLLPVVAPRVGGIPELVEHERTGLLYTAGEWQELASTLARLAKEPELRAELAVEGEKRVRAQHDIHREAAKLAELLGIGERG